MNLTGEIFNRLKVIEPAGESKHKQKLYLCQCVCGTMKTLKGAEVKSGKIQSCGCLRDELLLGRAKTHGESKNVPEYRAWMSIKRRCFYKKSINNKDYLGRGITVCERWKTSYENFLVDMGRRPTKNHSIERKNNNGNYEPANCKWATRMEQANNTRRTHAFEINGERITLTQIARKYNITRDKLRYRLLMLGWSFEKTISFFKNQPKVENNGKHAEDPQGKLFD